MKIRPERPEDFDTVYALIKTAFETAIRELYSGAGVSGGRRKKDNRAYYVKPSTD